MIEIRRTYEKHAVSKLIRKDLQAAVVKGLGELSGHIKKATYSPQEVYAYHVSNRLNELSTTMDRLLLSIHLLKNESTLEEVSFLVWADFFSYRVENVLIRIPAVLERALHLVNQVYSLNIPPSKCKFPAVVSNKQIKQKTKEALEKLKSEVDKFRHDRNLFAHEECFSDKILGTLHAHSAIIDDPDEALEVTRNAAQLKEDYIHQKLSEYTHFYNMAGIWVGDLLTSMKAEVASRVNRA